MRIFRILVAAALPLALGACGGASRSEFTNSLGRSLAAEQPAELSRGKKTVMTLFRCGTTWTDDHIGCARSAPVCVVSTDNQGPRNSADQSPIVRTPHLSEILVMRGNGAEIRRLAMSRSVPFLDEEGRGYWSSPRACISSDGSFIVADSNFGSPNRQRVIRINTGFGKP